MIKVIFPDRSTKEFESGISVIEVAKGISSSLAKKTVGAIIDDVQVDVGFILTEDCTLKLITEDDEKGFEILNHSTAHLLAQAITNLFPGAKFGIGPAIEEGFYYDIDVENEISEKDLNRIELEMKKLVKKNYAFKKEFHSYQEVKEIFANDPYKLELIEKIKARNEKFSTYTQGDFTDLCRGTHLPSIGKIKNFKLLSIAGAYWLGDSENKMLQRIYGTSWWSAKDLEDHLQVLDNRKNNDHRKIGKDLSLFTFTQETGAGLPLWLPNGATIRYELEKFIKDEEIRRGYHHVYTPVLGTKQLYETSGHWDHYQDDMFKPIEMDNETFVLRPMCCPHHAMIYKHELKSYKDLPYRVAELGGMHRYEASGALTGLERVRNMCLNDGHLFIRPDQIKEEFKKVIDLVNYAVETLNLEINYFRLSLRDPNNKEKYFDDDVMWNNAERLLVEVLDELQVDYRSALDEAAFYGPKLDIQIKTALGHDVTLSTIQLDFLLPERFDLTYVGQDGQKHRPVVIHRGIISTMERMTATLIEQYKGAFPSWLAPTQVNIIPVSLKVHSEFTEELSKKLKSYDFRVTLDDREEKLNYKIREAQVSKIPYTLIIGDAEVESNQVTYRKYGSQDNTTLSIEKFIEMLDLEIKNRT